MTCWRHRTDFCSHVNKGSTRECSLCVCLSVLPFLLLGGSSLHAVAGISQFEGELLAFEADPSQSLGTVLVVDYGRVVGGGRIQVDHVSRHFGHHILALEDAEFHITGSASPLEL